MLESSILKKKSLESIDEQPKKKLLLLSYLDGILDFKHGESYRTILYYFLPEFVITLLLYAFIPLMDARWIANLKSTSLYATIGVTNTLMHFIIKAAEGFSVGTTILTGQYNGLKEYKEVGRSAANAFWVTCFVGGIIATGLYCGAYWIYKLYGVPEKMIMHGIPFLRLRALSIFFMFIYFAFVGFLRGIKKPRIPMQIFMVGGALFLIADYVLINGYAGFPRMGLQGSALASIIQYSSMLLLCFGYLLFNKEVRAYGVHLFFHILNWQRMSDVFRLSLPVVLDKAMFAAAYIWLGYLINPMGKYAIASYSAIKDLERLAIQPAAAFAQVITFLVSNSYSVGDWQGIKSNIKKTVFLASVFVAIILALFSLWPHIFISQFDPKNKFTSFAATVFPFMSILVLFDVLQLILSGALRGAANVKIVMMGRLLMILCYFVPVSYGLAHLPLDNQMIKFFIVYSSFYIGDALLTIVYIARFRGERWKAKSLADIM